MENSYFRKEIGRRGIREFYIISDDRKTMMHAKRTNESFYDRYWEKKGYVNMGWDVYCGEYNPETDNIKPETHKLCMRGAQSHTDIMGRLLYTRRFNKGIKEYNSEITPMNKYEKSVTVWGVMDKKTTLKGAKNAIFLANPDNDEGMGFPRIKALIESGNLKDPTYYVQYSAQTFKKGKGEIRLNVPLALACFYDNGRGRELVIDRLPEYRSNELLKGFFPIILEEFDLYTDTRIFFKPNDEFETRLCRKYMFTPTGNENEYSVTEDEMYNVE